MELGGRLDKMGSAIEDVTEWEHRVEESQDTFQKISEVIKVTLDLAYNRVNLTFRLRWSCSSTTGWRTSSRSSWSTWKSSHKPSWPWSRTGKDSFRRSSALPEIVLTRSLNICVEMYERSQQSYNLVDCCSSCYQYSRTQHTTRRASC